MTKQTVRQTFANHFGVVLAAVLMFAAGGVRAADFYTSPSGDDANTCTSIAAPCKTIQAAINKAMAGDTVHVGQGNYALSSNRIVIDKAGLKLVGDNSPFDPSSTPGAPVLAANAAVLQQASANVPAGTNGMIWIRNVADVEVRNLAIDMSPSGSFSFGCFCLIPRAKEAIVATGAVDGLVIDDNYIVVHGALSQIGISVNLYAGNDSSVPSTEPRKSGQFVTISNNVVQPDVANQGAPKRAIATQDSVGTITGNQVAATTQDMWLQGPDGGSAHHDLTVSGNWFYGRMQLYMSSGSSLGTTLIDGNHFVAPASQAWGNGAEAHSVRVMGANGGAPTIISNNDFTGFGGAYRALWVMSRPNVTIEGNTFTPLAGQSDFTEIVVGNREVWNGLPAPNPYDVTIRGNTFNANGAPAGNTGKAILFVDDNDDGGVASFTSAQVGGPQLADANNFDAAIGWYIALDDRSCSGLDHNVASCNGTASYAIGQGIAYSGGSNQSSQKVPFKWDVNAVGNSFGGVYMSTMTQAEFDAVEAKTWDSHNATTNPGATGTVQYGYPPITSGTVAFTPTSFTYDGAAHAITATLQESPSTPCVVTPSSVTDAGDTTVAALCADAQYNVSGSATIHVDQATQAITNFAATPANPTYSAGGMFTVTATGGASGNAVTFASTTPTVCTVSGGTVTMLAAGTCGLTADQAGNANYTAAPQATLAVVIGKATGTVTWGTLSFPYDGTSPAVTATLTEDGSACTVTGTVGPGVGSYPVQANCNSANYTATASTTAEITAASASLVLGDLAQTYDGQPKSVSVTANPSSVTYSVTYDGSTQAPTDAGSYAVVAHITDANYTGSDASGTLVIAQATQAITNFAATPANPTYSAGGTFTVSATGGASGNAVTFASTTPTVCTVSGGTVTMLAAGTCGLTADQAGNANYTAAPQATLAVVITAPPQPDLAITIDDGRHFVQYGKPLSYVVTVSNVGNTDVSAATVASVLPATLIAGGWSCQTATLATCTASGTGDLHDTASLQVGGQITYVVDATVNNDPSIGTDEINVAATVTAAGDVNAANDTATDTTISVLFRDGFELGGDGAEPDSAGATSALNLAGAGASVLPLSAAELPTGRVVTVMRATDDAGDVVRVEALRSGRAVHVRLVGDIAGTVQFGGWSAVTGEGIALGLAHAGATATLLVAGTAESVELPLAPGATRLRGWQVTSRAQ